MTKEPFDSAPATPGSLPAEAQKDLILWIDFNARRDRIMDGLFGVHLPRDPLRDDLVRRVLAEFGAGHERPIAYYVERSASIASASSVRREIELMTKLGIFALAPSLISKRAHSVMPTQKTVDWYAKVMPSLRSEAARMLLP